MQTTYDGEHSILIDSKDLWTEFGLVPASRPSVVLPEPKINTLEVPGANGIIDMTDILLGYPAYGNRSGSWTFNIAHDVTGLPWAQTYAKLASFIHGQKRKVILLDDRSYYYEGRLTLGDYETGNNFSSVTINYDLGPFKWMIWSTTEPWLWDPFDLIYGEIPQETFVDIPITSGAQTVIQWDQNVLGCVPITPTFNVVSNDSNNMKLYLENSCNGLGQLTFDLVNGVNTNPQIEFVCPSEEDYTRMVITGSGTISIDFRPGRL